MSDSEILNHYDQISQRGRGAFCRGRLQEAAMYFEEALKIEQDIHLKGALLSHKQFRNSVCSDASSNSSTSEFTDEPIFASSPVSSSVSSPSSMAPSTPGGSYSGKRFPEILKRFKKSFASAEKAIATHPDEETGYLQKGAILCSLNSWDAAKEVYCQGIRRCRHGDKLRQALATINKLENMMETFEDKPDYDDVSLSTCSSGSERSGIDRSGVSPKQTSPSGGSRLKQVTSFLSRLRSSAFAPKLVPLNDTSEHQTSRARSVGDLLSDEITASPRFIGRRPRKCQSVSFDELDFHPGALDSTDSKKSKRDRKARSIAFDDLY